MITKRGNEKEELCLETMCFNSWISGKGPISKRGRSAGVGTTFLAEISSEVTGRQNRRGRSQGCEETFPKIVGDLPLGKGGRGRWKADLVGKVTGATGEGLLEWGRPSPGEKA